MRISDWVSYVCASDLLAGHRIPPCLLDGFGAFGVLPACFHFIDTARIADRRQPFKVATDMGETPCELRTAAAQRGISVNTEAARAIDRHEQAVAHQNGRANA